MTETNSDDLKSELDEQMASAGITGNSNQETTGETQKFLTFILKDENYGIDILTVREIIGYMDVTPVPQTPDFVKGVVNLRGKVIPVINLRQKFGMEEIEVTNETCIIVVEVDFTADDETNTVQMGIVVDTVEEVLDIPVDNIDPAPNFGGEIDTEYIEGMGKVDENVVILLNIDKVLTEEELVALQEVSDDT
ncbi:MAG: chemotaxis protein CheW [bacterium]